MRRRDDMTFPPEEYERRIEELRGRMEKRLLDAVVITDPENLMYLTDYQTTGYSFFQALVVPLEAEPFMITRQLEESNVIERTWVEVTRPYPDTGDAIQQLVQTLRDYGLDTKRVGYERNSYFFPAYQQDRIHNSFAFGTLMDCFGIVEEGRARKSEAEIEVMRRAARATQAGMRAGIAAAEVGVTENEVAAEIARGMFTAGGEYPAVMPYVTSGPRTMIGHATWEGRELESGDVVFLEVGGCYRRYHTAMMRTVLLHDMTPAMETSQTLMKRALDDLKHVLRPGVTVADADSIVRNVISDNGVGATLVTRAGYSIGIAFPPSWDEGYIVSLNPGDFSVIEEGMTFHVLPWMWGVEGTRTVGISDTLRITADGCESFFDLDRDFTVKGGPPARPEVVPTDEHAREPDSDDPSSDDQSSGLSAV